MQYVNNRGNSWPEGRYGSSMYLVQYFCKCETALNNEAINFKNIYGN